MRVADNSAEGKNNGRFWNADNYQQERSQLPQPILIIISKAKSQREYPQRAIPQPPAIGD